MKTAKLATVSLVMIAMAGSKFLPASSAMADEGVKVLYGFEVKGYLAGATPRRGRWVGKQWTGGGIRPGWRFKDHQDELKLPPDHDGPVSIYANTGSRDKPIAHLYRTGATEGKYARRLGAGPGWSYVRNYTAGKFTGLMAQPPRGSYHDIKDWFYQRYGSVLDDARPNMNRRRDWSGYALLRFDVLSKKAPVVLGMRVFDSAGPKIRAHYLGNRTGLAVFKIPQDKQITCEFLLAEMAATAELDLSKAQGFALRLNGYAGEAEYYVDNIRLVTAKAAANDLKHPRVKMEGEVEPYKRRVVYKPTPRDSEKLRRAAGPVEKIGPVTIDAAPYALYSCFGGHFGGSGVTYSQTLRRGCVAYDNNRLCFIFGGATKPAGGKRGKHGIFAMASFDGGKTWGGITPGEKEPTHLPTWGNHFRATGSSDSTGDIYMVGTENCSSYHEGYDILMRRLALTGDGWVDDRMSIASQNNRKCACISHAWRLANGRIWLTWTDGWGGTAAKCSDDDGYTWMPSKDAAITTLPRPFHQPGLEDLAKPAEQRTKPPANVLVWPSTPVPGPLLVPYKTGVALFGHKGRKGTDGDASWQVHDGTAWGPVTKTGLGTPAHSATVVGKDHLFIATRRKRLVVADFNNGKWTKETLEPDAVGDAILTASGKAAFCFYVKAVKEGETTTYQVRYRRWANGKWEPSVLVATEDWPINHVAAPKICPPDYAAIWWDERITTNNRHGKRPTMIRFARIPNK